MECKESDGTVQRTVVVTIKPTVTEVANTIWNMDAKEQLMLLGCLKRRFCDKEEGLLQMAAVANELPNIPAKKAEEAKEFIRCLANYVLADDILKRVLK